MPGEVRTRFAVPVPTSCPSLLPSLEGLGRAAPSVSSRPSQTDPGEYGGDARARSPLMPCPGAGELDLPGEGLGDPGPRRTPRSGTDPRRPPAPRSPGGPLPARPGAAPLQLGCGCGCGAVRAARCRSGGRGRRCPLRRRRCSAGSPPRAAPGRARAVPGAVRGEQGIRRTGGGLWRRGGVRPKRPVKQAGGDSQAAQPRVLRAAAAGSSSLL